MTAVTKNNLFKQSPGEAKVDATTRAARAIIDHERDLRDAKTARLKAARLAKEAEDAEAEAAVAAEKPARKTTSKAKAKKAA